jgi:hypothetical protein
MATVTNPLLYGRPEQTFVTAPSVGAAGTVVTVAALDAADAGPTPAAFVPVTVNVGVAPVAIPVTTIGDDAPVAVCPVLAVTVNDVAAFGPVGVNVTDTAPLLNGLAVPTSVAVPIVGAYGVKKSFVD